MENTSSHNLRLLEIAAWPTPLSEIPSGPFAVFETGELGIKCASSVLGSRYFYMETGEPFSTPEGSKESMDQLQVFPLRVQTSTVAVIREPAEVK